MALINRNVWKGHDNKFKLRLESSGPDGVAAPTDLTLVTKMELELNDMAGTIYTVSTSTGDSMPVIDWEHVDLDTGEVDFDLGNWTEAEEIPAGSYKCRLTVFSPTTSDGLVWLSWIQDDLTVTVVD